jgi:hypothetical protein
VQIADHSIYFASDIPRKCVVTREAQSLINHVLRRGTLSKPKVAEREKSSDWWIERMLLKNVSQKSLALEKVSLTIVTFREVKYSWKEFVRGSHA